MNAALGFWLSGVCDVSPAGRAKIEGPLRSTAAVPQAAFFFLSLCRVASGRDAYGCRSALAGDYGHYYRPVFAEGVALLAFANHVGSLACS